MKMLFSLLIIEFTILATALQENKISTTREEEGVGRDVSDMQFKQLAEQWRQAYNSKDATKLASLYTKDAEYISAHVAGYVAHGRDRVIANFQHGAKSGGYIDTLEVLSSNSSCNMSTLVTRYVGMAGGNKVNGRNLLVCKNINGQWLIVTHMTVVRD